ncbi:MAG: hypothetical protein ACYSVY_05660 [Planctomycetota bacterium]
MPRPRLGATDELYCSIQDGIDASINGDEIDVAARTHVEKKEDTDV